MKTFFASIALALILVVSAAVMVGWVYEGPRRFIRRLRLRRAVR